MNKDLSIKIDIDGFDWDAILSGENTIKRFKPLLFFECVILNNFQYRGYKSITNILLENYDYILVLDNFGYVYFVGSLNEETLNNIFIKSYLCSKKINKDYYYFDILMYNRSHESIINNALEKLLDNP